MMKNMLLTLIFLSRLSLAGAWPMVKSTGNTVEFVGDDVNYFLPINDKNGKLQYRLECHNYDYEGDEDFNFSGDFECRLSSVNQQERYSNLLTYTQKQTADWENRGLFYTAHFSSHCKSNRDWGKRRVFMMRGMTIELLISNEIIEKNGNGSYKLKSFSFTVSVKNTPSFDSEIYVVNNVPEWFHNPIKCIGKLKQLRPSGGQ